MGVIFYIQFYKHASPYQKVIFSQTLYPNERALIKKQLENEGGQSLEKITKAGISIGIDKIDINDDGIKDILVFIEGTPFGGSHGYTTEIYSMNKSQIFNPHPFLNLWNISTFGKMVVLNTTHKGYRDIVFLGGDPNHFDRRLVYYCYWSGKGYGLSLRVPYHGQFGGFR